MMNADEQPAESAAAQPDPAAVRADDSFVEALHGRNGGSTETTPVATELARLVLAWKREIDAEAFPPQLDELTIRRALPGRARRRLLTPVAAAAAAVGIALSGVALLAHDAHPGDPLWGITQVVYADHARSVAAATEAQADLGVAERALAAGSPEAAHTALQRVSSALRSVRDPDLRAKLSAVLTSLRAQLPPGTPPAVAAPPPSPPAVATVPPAPTVATVATVTVAPRPSPAPRVPATPSDIPAPTTIPSSSTEPPATSPPAPLTAAPTTTMPAPTSAPVTTDSGQPAPAEVTPESTPPPSAELTPAP